MSMVKRARFDWWSMFGDSSSRWYQITIRVPFLVQSDHNWPNDRLTGRRNQAKFWSDLTTRDRGHQHTHNSSSIGKIREPVDLRLKMNLVSKSEWVARSSPKFIYMTFIIVCHHIEYLWTNLMMRLGAISIHAKNIKFPSEFTRSLIILSIFFLR